MPEINPLNIQTSKESFTEETNWRDIRGFLLRLTEEPTHTPKGMFEQIVVVTTGGSSRAYIYDTVANNWKSTVIA